MNYKKIILKDVYPNLESDAYLEILAPKYYDQNDGPYPVMYIIPGGGYSYCSSREADPIAIKFMDLGYITAILHYTCLDSAPGPVFPKPILDILAGMDYLKNNIESMNGLKDKISVVGFSAGGHLVGLLGGLYNCEEYTKDLKLSGVDLRPFSICLAYAVINLETSTHYGTRSALLGNNEDMYTKMSVQNLVTKDYPPTFLWCTETDEAVPSENTKTMAKALLKAQVFHKMIIFPEGRHGLATADFLTCEEGSRFEEVAKWPRLFDNFNKMI